MNDSASRRPWLPLNAEQLRVKPTDAQLRAVPSATAMRPASARPPIHPNPKG